MFLFLDIFKFSFPLPFFQLSSIPLQTASPSALASKLEKLSLRDNNESNMVRIFNSMPSSFEGVILYVISYVQ